MANTLVLLVAGHYALGLIKSWSGALSSSQRQQFVKPIDTPVYADLPDRYAFWKEHQAERARSQVTYTPYYHWRRRPFAGTYINVDSSGIRRTVKASRPGAKKVFLLGGSTAWGTGVPDAHTIASLLQERLGAGYDVYNFGETAYVAAQELHFLMEKLAQGHVPDLVIFYDGANDGYTGAYSPAIPRDPQNIRQQAAEWEEWRRFKGASALKNLYRASHYDDLVVRVQRLLNLSPPDWDEQVAPHIPDNASGVIETYAAHIKQVKALASAYGFEAFFFWQPYLLYNTRRTAWDYERAIYESTSPVWRESQRSVYEAAKSRFSHREAENIFFIANIFDEVEAPIYIDPVHVGPQGNALIADRMYQSILPTITPADLR